MEDTSKSKHNENLEYITSFRPKDVKLRLIVTEQNYFIKQFATL